VRRPTFPDVTSRGRRAFDDEWGISDLPALKTDVQIERAQDYHRNQSPDISFDRSINLSRLRARLRLLLRAPAREHGLRQARF
jgi:hypothetical protein